MYFIQKYKATVSSVLENRNASYFVFTICETINERERETQRERESSAFIL